MAVSLVLQGAGVDPAALGTAFASCIGNHPRPGSRPEPVSVLAGEDKRALGDTPFLDRYGRDLTQAAREGKLGPYIGRRQELLQIIQTLACASNSRKPVIENRFVAPFPESGGA